VLEVLSDAETPLPLPELCARLGLHRSVVYRLLRTLEEHGLAARDDDGKVRLGLGLAALARSVQPDLRDAALPELTRVANAVGMTAFLTVLMDGEVVTLVSTQPHRGGGIVAQQPGSRHRLDVGAPGPRSAHSSPRTRWIASACRGSRSCRAILRTPSPGMR
jgi:DNA-binding IclR family transcriptional regulator